MTIPIGTRLAGKTPRQMRTAALPVDGHYSLMGAARRHSQRASTRVDHSGIATKPSERIPVHGYTLTLAGSVGL